MIDPGTERRIGERLAQIGHHPMSSLTRIAASKPHPCDLDTALMDAMGQQLVRMASGHERVDFPTLELCARIITHLTAKIVLIRGAVE